MRNYASYGGRGIIVCDEWREDFAAFFRDMGPRPTAEHSINRINNDGNYTPDNCEWSTLVEQANNTRTNRVIEFNSQQLTVAQWARKTGIHCSVLYARLDKLGWSVQRTLTTPVRYMTPRS